MASTLASSLIGYTPIIDAKRHVIASRVVIAPQQPNTSVAKIYRDFAAISPTEATRIVLSVRDGIYGDDLLELSGHPDVWLELPALELERPELRAMAPQLHAKGIHLSIGGRTLTPLGVDLAQYFSMAMIDVAHDRRLNMPVVAASIPSAAAKARSIPYAQSGVSSIALMERCFATGAVAIAGWPFEDTAKHATSASTNPDFSTVTRLIQLIDKQADLSEMDELIRRDPALAFKLLRYVNSPGFGLRVEIQSFRHAVMMLGLNKLKRWLVLLLANSCKSPNLRPLMFASFRRGLFLESLVAQSQDESLRDEVFILGVFSFLDKMFKENFETLFSTLYVPEAVKAALVDADGPHALYLAIAQAVEQGPSLDLTDHLDAALLSVEQCNRAALRALQTADLPGD
jgi:EAL and modified HD-GYP domain-containing signal transduction protein